MDISVFDLFSIGIGPSSSHTLGPMRSAYQFIQSIEDITLIKSIRTDLYGSLALTGKGHCTDMALILGLEGQKPDKIQPNEIAKILDRVKNNYTLHLNGSHPITFNEENDLIFHMDKFLPYHPNAMRFTATDASGKEIHQEIFYSIGGGFFISHHDIDKEVVCIGEKSAPYPFSTCDELLQHCDKHNLTIAELMLANEKVFRDENKIKEQLLEIWSAMKQSVENGCKNEGILPGGLNVKRRAPELYHSLLGKDASQDPGRVMDWASLFALAVNEENAAGGRVVTSPTNGAAGVIPAVMHYYEKYEKNPQKNWVMNFLLTAGAIGILYKKNASISAAEMGCQGEIGVACSMAAGALAAISGGNNKQVEIAAEIGMEHNLGLTCDPILGLVQIPCIERNTMGTIKAINASRLALQRDGTSHIVSLDQVIETMYQTGKDMQSIYKETSKGGLAVNVIEC